MRTAILLVCSANRCRSPLAAALLARLLGADPDAPSVESAGLHARPGLPATAETLAAATAVGLDLSAHRARDLKQLGISNYALVLAMEEVQAEALRAEYPALAGRILTLGELLNLHIDIDDPTGQGLGAHHALVRQLERYLRALLPRLLQRVQA